MDSSFIPLRTNKSCNFYAGANKLTLLRFFQFGLFRKTGLEVKLCTIKRKAGCSHIKYGEGL